MSPTHRGLVSKRHLASAAPSERPGARTCQRRQPAGLGFGVAKDADSGLGEAAGARDKDAVGVLYEKPGHDPVQPTYNFRAYRFVRWPSALREPMTIEGSRLQTETRADRPERIVGLALGQSEEQPAPLRFQANEELRRSVVHAGCPPSR